MIRVVFDTNVIISGSLWSGAPSRALNAARDRRVKAYVSEALLDEFLEVIIRPKFSSRLNLLNLTPSSIVTKYLEYAEIVEAKPIPPFVITDSDDDIVLACALAVEADYIVSGDPHLLELGIVGNIAVLSPNAFVQQIEDTAA